MFRGYVRLWRKALDTGWIRHHKLWAFWTWCLLKATHKERDAIVGRQVVHLLPGQFIFGRKKAAEETGLSEQEIRTIIELLKKTENLTIKPTNKYSVISVINWNTYQDDIPDERPSKQPTNNQQITTDKHVKHEKNIFVAHHGTEKIPLQDGIQEVLSFLNEKRAELLGSNGVKPITAAGEIAARLKEGRSVTDLCRVLLVKSEDPFFRENVKYYHPRTLFRKSNTDRYLDEVELVRAKRTD